jgi:hypothetical protein
MPGRRRDTVRFITDGRFFTDIGLDLHNNFVGSQLGAAVRFLREHPGQVSPVTISTGDDDIFDAVYNCNADPTCMANTGLAERLSNNLGHILSALHAAAPDAEIIMYLPHNILEVDVPDSDPAFGPYLDEMRAIAAAHRVRVVDGFAAITASGRSCELTDLCISDDGHPNDAGYELLGHLFLTPRDTSAYWIDPISTGGTVMRRLRTVLLSLSAVTALITSNAAVAAPPAATPTAHLLAGGFEGGSGSTVGPDGMLYVTERTAGRVSRVDPRTGEVTTFASGLPKAVIFIGGAMDIAFLGRTAYVLVTLVGPDVGGNDVVGIYRVDGPHTFTVVADIGAFAASHPPNPS